MHNQPASLLSTALLQLQQQGAAQTAALQQQGAALQQQLTAQAATLQQIQQQLAVRHRNDTKRQLNAFRLQHADNLHPLVREQPGVAQGALPPAGVWASWRRGRAPSR